MWEEDSGDEAESTHHPINIRGIPRPKLCNGASFSGLPDSRYSTTNSFDDLPDEFAQIPLESPKQPRRRPQRNPVNADKWSETTNPSTLSDVQDPPPEDCEFVEIEDDFTAINIGRSLQPDTRYQTKYVPPGPLESAYHTSKKVLETVDATGRTVVEAVNTTLQQESFAPLREALEKVISTATMLAQTAQAVSVLSGVASGSPMAFGQAAVYAGMAIKSGQNGLIGSYGIVAGKVKEALRIRGENKKWKEETKSSMQAHDLRGQKRETDLEDPLNHDGWEIYGYEERNGVSMTRGYHDVQADNEKGFKERANDQLSDIFR